LKQLFKARTQFFNVLGIDILHNTGNPKDCNCARSINPTGFEQLENAEEC
jgi:hypothetical protein